MQVGSKETQILMKSEKFTDEEIWGWYHSETGDFMDNYVSVKYHEQTTERTGEALKEVFGEADFVFEVNSGFSFEEYTSSDENCLAFTATVDSNFTVEDMNEFKLSLSSTFENISVPKLSIIAFASNSDLFNQ